MNIITKTGEIWSENAIGAVISLIKESNDSIEAERKLTHWLTEMNCQLIAVALARIDAELYQIYKVQGWRVARRDSRTIYCPLWRADLYPKTFAERREELLSPGLQNGL